MGSDFGTNEPLYDENVAAATITDSSVVGVTPPMTGATPVTTITVDPQFTGTVTWSRRSNEFRIIDELHRDDHRRGCRRLHAEWRGDELLHSQWCLLLHEHSEQKGDYRGIPDDERASVVAPCADHDHDHDHAHAHATTNDYDHDADHHDSDDNSHAECDGAVFRFGSSNLTSADGTRSLGSPRRLRRNQSTI